MEGNPGGPGRPPGSKNVFPPGTKLALKELMEGRLLADGKTAAEILVEALLEGMQGKAAVVSDKHGRTTISPLGFIQTYMDYVSKHEALEAANAKEKGTGGGGIRIVLPNPVVDPLLKPGQQPRPLRLLGQDPSKPLPETTGTTTEAPASSGPVPAQSPAPNSEDAFDPAELIEDFEHPICQICMATGMVRDENGIHMVTCDHCEGKGRAPARE